uniref:Urea ABC transporter ATP-binding subunit UrtE n=2 Tax=unclassified Prevotella TaxID=2638335 RepID=A0AB33J2S0_9BACT
MLEIKDPSLTLGGRELLRPHHSFIVHEGEILCVTGDKGSGKTALLRALMGLQPLDSGFVNTDGDLLDERSAPYLRREMGYVPQCLDLPHETVEQLIKEYLGMQVNALQPVDREQLLAQWRAMGIDKAYWQKRVEDVPRGMLQWILVSLIAVTKKKYVLVDEWDVALNRQLVMMALRQMADNGAAVVVVSNDGTIYSGCQKHIALSE